MTCRFLEISGKKAVAAARASAALFRRAGRGDHARGAQLARHVHGVVTHGARATGHENGLAGTAVVQQRGVQCRERRKAPARGGLAMR